LVIEYPVLSKKSNFIKESYWRYNKTVLTLIYQLMKVKY